MVDLGAGTPIDTLSTELFTMIDKVSQASDERSAFLELLYPLLRLFDMDQAVLCEKQKEAVTSLFALDRTKRILPAGHQLWISNTLLEESLGTMEPAIHSSDLSLDQGIPLSISEYSLKNVVCIPLSQSPGRAIYLASQRHPQRRITSQELLHLKIASRAAFLALQQHHCFRELRDSNERLQSALENREKKCLYASPEMDSVMRELSRVAPFDISVVFLGESGVGKEILAREIHRLSGRKGSFVAVNCANLTETLLESELFGFARGAFTGAMASKKGLLQEAEGGTFFFDEVGEFPLGLQAKLLRVLQEKGVRPLGTTKDIPLDVRVIAASHCDLREAVKTGRFREDLYYRLQQMTIEIPPLRKRPADIELLARHFFSRFTAEFQQKPRSLDPEALGKILAHDWPGNVRELENACRTAVILASGASITAEDIRLPTKSSPKAALPETGGLPEGGLRELSQRFEQSVIRNLLDEPGQSQVSVAKRLNISVRTLQRILNKECEPELEAWN